MTVEGRAFARWSSVDTRYRSLVERQGSEAAFMPSPTLAAPSGWVVDAGIYGIHVGRSSVDIAHSTAITVR